MADLLPTMATRCGRSCSHGRGTTLPLPPNLLPPYPALRPLFSPGTNEQPCIWSWCRSNFTRRIWRCATPVGTVAFTLPRPALFTFIAGAVYCANCLLLMPQHWNVWFYDLLFLRSVVVSAWTSHATLHALLPSPRGDLATTTSCLPHNISTAHL